MFVPCPHCGFLVALIVRPDGAPQRCPRCDGLVQDDAEAPIDESAPAATTQSGSSDASNVARIDAPEPSPTTDDATTVTPATNDDGTTVDVDDVAVETTPERSYEAAIAAANVGGTPARATRRAARPRRKGEPSFARHTAQRTTTRTHWGWYAAISALALLFALQLLLAQRHELAADARWRPLVSGSCTVLRCDVPAWREPAAFTMLQRSVRPQPNAAGVLAVDASFRNDARWPQPWPTLVLSLSDVDGRPVGVRAFAPAEYRTTHRPDDRLLPGQSAHVTFQVIEPAPRIVAFTFDFR
ncbi:DUF3426 domain-containing protein [Lysobacter auxotrophicus]|uniref:DUF3426 domain-containing protein n=1 Tax=Lysobacter auxotrophicus TaxID=2992573 RepID=A0ABN6UNV4_9GAMM|nr:DUF3426 domain-containing protein [Lysobacter auxotrophicus]BDU18049.1 DUF3426 domain-containing protein [Lysobacter auxotrophicus]